MVHVQDGGAALAHLLIGVLAERVHIHVRQRESRIDVIAQPCDGRRVCAHTQHQHLLAVGDGRDRFDHVAERGDVYRHFLHVYEAVDHRDADLGLRLVIQNDGFERMAVDAALGVDVLDRPANRLHLVLAENRRRPGQRVGDPEAERLFLGRRRVTGERTTQQTNHYGKRYPEGGASQNARKGVVHRLFSRVNVNPVIRLFGSPKITTRPLKLVNVLHESRPRLWHSRKRRKYR